MSKEPRTRYRTSRDIYLDMMTRVTALRHNARLSQMELVKAINQFEDTISGVGSLKKYRMSQQAISKLETAGYQDSPVLDAVLSLARFYRVSPEFLLFGIEPPPPVPEPEPEPDISRLLEIWSTADITARSRAMMALIGETKH